VSFTTTTYTYWTTGLASTYGDRGVGTRFTQTNVVTKNSGAKIDFDAELETLISEGVVPALGDLAALTGLANYARCRGYTVRSGPGQQVIVDIQWDTQYVRDPCPGEEGSPYALPSSISYSTVIRSTPVFRTGWTTDPPPSSDASADIGGTALAGGQVSMAQNVSQVRIKLSFTQDASVTGISSAVTLANYADKLNSDTFLGVAAGYLLCEGVNLIQTSHEFYTVQFDFLYDQWAHHSQVADLDGDGRIKQTSGAPSVVKWKRVARSTTDFNNIYVGDTRLKGITEQGYWLPCTEPEP
jgi:hypothetical protein